MATTLVSGALPSYTIPKVQTPTFDARTGARVDVSDPTTAASKAFIQQQLAALPGQYAAQKTSAAARAAQGLAGYGGYGVDAAGNVTYDASQWGQGQQERTAVRGQRSSANASGTLYSSFTDTGVADALNRLSETAKGVVNQYADQLSGYLTSSSQQATSLYGQWAGLIGQDASFQLANPPTGTPTMPAQDTTAVTPGISEAVAQQAGLPAGGPAYSGTLAQKYGGIYGSAGSDPTKQMNVITSWLQSHYGGTNVPRLLKRAQTDPAYARTIYNAAVGGTTLR